MGLAMSQPWVAALELEAISLCRWVAGGHGGPLPPFRIALTGQGNLGAMLRHRFEPCRGEQCARVEHVTVFVKSRKRRASGLSNYAVQWRTASKA